MPFWKAGKNDDQVLDELKETQKQNADEFVKKQEHADEAQKSSLIIDNNFTPVEYDPQYILQVNHLKKYFPIKGGMVSKTVGYVKAVDGVTFNLKRGTTMGLVGESGCGKTTTGRTILRLYDSKSGGQVLFNGQEVYDLSHKELRALRTKMQIIFQDPFSSLSPRLPVGEIIGEAVREHNLVPKNEFDDYIDQVMDNCGLQPFHKDRYPHEFSGGQRQRICIARALALKPEFIVCDEPVSALDVSIQAQIINLLKTLQEKRNLTYLFISHDLSVVEHISDTVGVMYLGNLVEYGETDDIFANPLHPYTKALFSAIPIPDPTVKRERIVLQGSIPSPANPPSGCKFHTRCAYCTERCKHGDRIRFTVTQEGDHADITIRDDGVRIPPEKLGTIFIPLRVTGVDFSDLSSNSFGLTVALGIAEKHDGTILLESNEWGGTTFHVVLSTVLPETNLFRAPKVPYGHAQEDPIRIYLSDQMPKQEL